MTVCNKEDMMSGILKCHSISIYTPFVKYYYHFAFKRFNVYNKFLTANLYMYVTVPL